MIDVTGMTFLWPGMLWLLLAVPGFVALYASLLARRKRAALRYASLAPVGEASGAAGRIRRHVPPVLFLLGLTAMLFAVARPHAVTVLPAYQDTIILAMDASGSMRATDIKPNRLAAAQGAAKSFIAGLPRHVRVGVVAIAAAAAVVQSPTRNREDVIQAIDRFQLQRGSAIGSGLIISLATLLPEAGIDVEYIVHGRSSQPWLDSARKAEGEKAVAAGSNGSAAIVLLSDGEANVGPDPMEAAKLAARHGVRIHTVGIGTIEGATLGFEGWSMRVRLDEEMLRKVAAVTRGEYFQARNAADLKKVYGQLSTRLALERKSSSEVTAVFVAIGAALAMLGAVVSMFWFSRIL
jgi:Ca-activated chloride channel family protein